MNLQGTMMMLIPADELALMKSNQEEILQQLKELRNRPQGSIPINNITAKEFMAAVRISRTKFDQLVQTSKIKIIKKRRKIYVPISEIDRYFNDAGTK